VAEILIPRFTIKS